jgi:phage tail sheath protein FI
MPEYLAPGVYIEETSFRAKSIEGVSTTTTGFIGPTRYGPLDLEPDVITSLGEFERVYGDRVQLQFSDTGALHNYMWHAARAFFEEGGKRLYIARVFTPKSDTDAGIASAKIPADVAAAPGAAAGAPPETRFPKAVHLRARFPGAAGNVNVRFGLRIGQNILRQDDQGKPVLSAALLNGDVVWIGKRRPCRPPLQTRMPRPSSTT